MTRQYRLTLLHDKLKARLDGTGKPYPGYAQNVEAIRKEIEKLEERSTYAGMEWPE